METKYKVRVCTSNGPLSHMYYIIYVCSQLNLHRYSFLITNGYNRYPRKRLTKRLIEKLMVSNVLTKIDFIDPSDITILEYAI